MGFLVYRLTKGIRHPSQTRFSAKPSNKQPRMGQNAPNVIDFGPLFDSSVNAESKRLLLRDEIHCGVTMRLRREVSLGVP